MNQIATNRSRTASDFRPAIRRALQPSAGGGWSDRYLRGQVAAAERERQARAAAAECARLRSRLAALILAGRLSHRRAAKMAGVPWSSWRFLWSRGTQSQKSLATLQKAASALGILAEVGNAHCPALAAQHSGTPNDNQT